MTAEPYSGGMTVPLVGMLGRWRPTATVGRVYFALQALAGAGWWVTVFTVPAIREATLGRLDPVLMALLDIPLFVIASALASAGLRWAALVATGWTAAVAAGMAVYATFTTLAGWGALLMIVAAGFSVLATLIIFLGRLPTEWVLIGPFAFREARERPALSHGASTLVQIVVFWGVLLGLVPAVILFIEQRWGMHVDAPLAVRVLGGVAFVAAALLGLRAAAVMATIGRGTPLPRFTAPVLVIAGPYRWVRNPMAVAGIGQGIAVGIMLSSWLVVAYALVGALIWNWAVRPYEEADLEARFGEPFRTYRDSVSCWVPSLRR